MIIKAAYYLKSTPTKIAIILPDDTVKVTDLAPYRKVTTDELETFAALDQAAYRKHMLVDAIPDYLLRFYGLSKI